MQLDILNVMSEHKKNGVCVLGYSTSRVMTFTLAVKVKLGITTLAHAVKTLDVTTLHVYEDDETTPQYPAAKRSRSDQDQMPHKPRCLRRIRME